MEQGGLDGPAPPAPSSPLGAHTTVSEQDVVYRTDGDGHVLWISDSVGELLGRTAEALMGTDMFDLLHPEDHERALSLRTATLDGREFDGVPLRFRTATGGYRPMRCSARRVLDDDEVPAGSLVVMRDLHESFTAQRALATVLTGNRVLIRATHQGELLQDMCDAIAVAGGYAFAWYGVPVDDEERSVRPVAIGGDDHGYVAQVRASWGDGPRGAGPTGRCLRTGMIQLAHDLEHEPGFEPWRDAASGRGIRCSLSIPVLVDEVVVGALMVYSREEDAFDDLAQELLANLAEDLGFGLARLADSSRLRATLASIRDPHIVLTALRDQHGAVVDFTYTYANTAACEYIGLDREALIGQRLTDVIPELGSSSLLDVSRQALLASDPITVDDYLTRTARFGERWMDLRAAPMGDSLSYTWRDVTERHLAAEAVQASEHRFRLLAENAMDLVFSVGEDGVIEWMSPSVTTVLGYEVDEVVGKTAAEFLHPDDLAQVARAAAAVAEGPVPAYRVRYATKAGGYRWMEVNVRPMHDVEEGTVGRVITVRDIDSEVHAERALEHAMTFDALTGLARQPLALERVADLLEPRRDGGWSLLCVGVRGLRAVNQAYGFAAGDLVLRAVAVRLVEVAGADDRVARIAGDEFALLLPDLDGPEEAAAAAERVLEAVRGPVEVEGAIVEVRAAVGIATHSGEAADVLLRDAIAALRLVGTESGEGWAFADTGLAERARHVLDVRRDLRAALDAQQVQPWFMPIVTLDDGSLCGYEALVRWVRDDGTVVPPDAFLPEAESSGLILEIDAQVLRRSLDVLAGLAPDVHMAVNMSAATMSSDGMEDQVRAELARTGIAPHRLHLEVTETALFRATSDAVTRMRSLADLGVVWWVDDFGTGYSSVSHLRDLPVHGLKLDRSFTSLLATGGPDEARAARLTVGLSGLASGLGLDTVAEGVETAEQAAVLVEQGWRLGQGWLYGKPAPLVG